MSRPRVVAVLEARMGSSRLPGKSMLPLAGAPLVQRVVERIRRAKAIDELVVATTDAPRDDVLAEHLRALGTEVYRGSEDDVLDRILGACHAYHADVHVQLWGDCPFVEPSEVDRTVGALLASERDLVGNDLGTPPRTLPFGLDVLALRVTALEQAERETRGNARHREHGTSYIYESPNLFRLAVTETPRAIQYPLMNLTVNTRADYEFCAAIYERLYPTKAQFSFFDVLGTITGTPALREHPNAGPLPPSAG